MDKYIRSWRESSVAVTHGAMEKYEIFTKTDTENPNKSGGVLQHIKEFSRLVLPGKIYSQKEVHINEQEVFYVVRGEGKIITDKREEVVREGSAFFVPAKVPHIFVNNSDKPLELLVVTENISDEKPIKDDIVFVKDYKQLEISKKENGELLHWNHNPRTLFAPEDGLHVVHYASIVSMDARKIAEPHSHSPGTDEIWYQLEGTSHMWLGNRIIRQEPGTAIMIPPDNKTLHASITLEKPATWFFFLYNPQEDKR